MNDMVINGGKRKLALVLAGGGSLGSYEVGAIKALEELGYEFDIVTGTSIGGLNGAFVMGHQTDKLQQLWEAITPEKVMKDGMNLSVREAQQTTAASIVKNFGKFANVYVTGGKPGADISPFKAYVKSALDVKKCLASDIKFGVVATKFPTKKLVDLHMNDAAEEDFLPYLHCTSACFPIFPIEVVHGVKYIDGFYNDNLPIRLAFNYGANDVIAIDMRLFQLHPQNEFYLQLPNVTYIAPYINFGSLMDFSQNVIRQNMKLGYLDVMKHYKRIHGYTFAIEGDFKVHGFLADILSQYGTDSKYIISALTKDIRGDMNETDYFVRTLELIAIRLGITDYYKAYTLQEFINMIKNKSLQNSNSSSLTVNIKRMVRNVRKNIELFKADRVLNKFLRDFSAKYLSVEVGENKFLTFGETQYLDLVKDKHKEKDDWED